jgi:RimJ/RimL family protein N-acetyltransferase
VTVSELFEQQKSQHFPIQINPDVIAQTVDLQTYFDVEDALEPVTFPENDSTNRWFSLPSERQDERKHALFALQRKTHLDAVVFYCGEEAIGWSAGRMTGASEFMMDVTGIHPDYQGQGIYTTFLKAYLPYLRDVGYERVISYHSPTNRAVLIAKLKVGFIIAGTEFREHAGASVKLSYLLHEDRYRAFEDVHSLQPQAFIKSK